MIRTTTAKGTVVVGMLALLGALLKCVIPFAHAEDSHVKGTMIVPPIEERAATDREAIAVVPRAAEDTLKACMARIPKVASVGQHMLAEQSCMGEEKTRKAMRSAPKF
jgi:ribosomal protein S8E